MEPTILVEASDYRVQNFALPPPQSGLPRREGGKVFTTQYTSRDDLSHMLSPQEYELIYANNFDASSVVQQYPMNKSGTGNRRINKSMESLRSHRSRQECSVLFV